MKIPSPALSETKVLYITSEKVIVNLLAADKKKYLSIPRLYRFVAFLRQELENKEVISSNTQIVFDVNFDSIERTVLYNDMVYDLIGDKIYLKGILPEILDNEKFLSVVAEDFAARFAA